MDYLLRPVTFCVDGDVFCAADKTKVAQEEDLGELIVVPGFHDCHLHLLGLALQARQMDLGAYCTPEVALEALKIRIHQTAPIIGFGWDQAAWGRAPTSEELTMASPNTPVLFLRRCTHLGVANKAALALVSSKSTSGILIEEELDKLRTVMTPGLRKKEIKEMLFESLQRCSQAGLSVVHSDDFGEAEYNFRAVLEAYKELEEEGRLSIRVFLQARLPTERLVDEFLCYAKENTIAGLRWTVSHLKLILDGTLGAQTALLTQPYANGSQYGVQNIPNALLLTLVKKMCCAGFPAALHAIGDAAVEQALWVFGESPHPRHAVVHCQLTNASQLSRVSCYAIVQPAFLPSDLECAKCVLPSTLLESSYAFHHLAQAGTKVCFSTDAPIEPLHVEHTLNLALEQGFSLQEVVESYSFTPQGLEGSSAVQFGTPGTEASFLALQKSKAGYRVKKIWLQGRVVE